ncbi:sensor histidine kinase [Actinophytocola sp.]|uniref:sensor histidine kinase n=1 Tax=Actinophytocola sp. TaxID=1872138 RepID=UPI002ED116F2
MLPFLLVAVPLCAEDAGRWVELVISLVAVGLAFAGFSRFPVLVVALAVAGVLVPALVLAPTATNPVRVWPYVACAVVAYLAGRRVPVRPALAAFGGTLAAGLLAGVLADVVARGGFGLIFGLYDWFLSALVLLVVAVLPWLAGRYRGQGAEMVAAGIERAALLERTRIAREMHDSLGHEWGLIALRAAALEVSPALDEDARARVGELRAGVATATERLHEIVRLLGEPETDLAGLVEHARAAGQRVELAGEAPARVARTVLRVVREGLTNAARHAPGTPVTVRVETAGEHTTVTVENPLSGGESSRGNGSGLAGLRDVVGRLEAGADDGRFVLTATVPHDPPATGRAPSRVWRLVRVPALAAGVTVVLGAGLYFVAGLGNRLDPAVYQTLHIGQPQEDVEQVLPRFQILGDPERTLPAPPPGADCRQYWAEVQTEDRLFYRLCFVDGRLAVKETVPR